METLTIEHLAPYLPYDLKLTCNMLASPVTLAGLGTDTDGIKKIFIHHSQYTAWYPVEHFLPILKPLIELTKEELIKEGFTSHIDFLTNERMNPFGYKPIGYEHRSGAPAEMVNYLYKNHYDVFGLIDRGLAAFL